MLVGKKRRRSSTGASATATTSGGSAPAILPPKYPRPPHPAGPGSTGTEADAYYRTLYATEPDFRQLARDDPDFAKVLKHGQIDFTDPKSVVQLTKTLLKADFGLRVELPLDRLCPPVPNRHNYILWLKDLLDTTSYSLPGTEPVRGLDIGTGASCIYPLLGCTQRNWSFVGTDIDETSLTHASHNISTNALTPRITLLHRGPTSPLIPTTHLPFSFSMTNPPFYASRAELDALAAQKSRPPLTACTGSPSEMVTPGGEVAFVAERLLPESLALREQVGWYTAMLGKHTSVFAVVDALRAAGIDNYAVTEFVQGSKTRRWAVGWSFGAMRPDEHVCRRMDEPSWRSVLPAPVRHDVFVAGADSVDTTRLIAGVNALGQALELAEWVWDEAETSGRGRARQNVWSRAWRRKKMRAEKEGEAGAADLETGLGGKDAACAIGFKLSVVAGLEEVKVICRWTEGHDHLLLESLLGFLRTRISSLMK